MAKLSPVSKACCDHDYPNNSTQPSLTRLTAWHNNVCQSHGGLNVLIKSWLDKLIVLFDNTLNVPSTLRDVPPQPPYQTDV